MPVTKRTLPFTTGHSQLLLKEYSVFGNGPAARGGEAGALHGAILRLSASAVAASVDARKTA